MSRRSLRYARWMLLTLSLWSAPLNAQDQTSSRSIILETPANLSFDSDVEQNFPGLTRIPQYDQIRPFLVLLTNQTALTAKAYAVRWKVSTAEGPEHVLDSLFVRTHFLIPSANHSLRPGEERLISPLFNLSPSEFQDHPSFSEEFPSALYPHFSERMTITAQLDEVVYADGSFSGSNATRLLQLYRCSRNAEHDEAIEVLSLANSGADQVTLDKMLKTHMTRGFSAQGTSITALYIHARAEQAAAYRDVLRRMGPDAFTKRLKDLGASWSLQTRSHMGTWF